MRQRTLGARTNRILRKGGSEVRASLGRADDELIVRMTGLLEDNYNRRKSGITIINEAGGSRRHHDGGNDISSKIFWVRQFS